MFVDASPPGECIFCKLIAGNLPSARVFEDDLTVAFMDIGQVNPGHVLIASKRHAETLFDQLRDKPRRSGRGRIARTA